MNNIRKYGPICYLGLKQSIVYRANYVIKLVTRLMNLVVAILMWKWLLANNSVEFTSITKYLVLTNVLSILFTFNSSFELAELIRSGKISIYLTKPISIYWYLLAHNLGMLIPNLIFYLGISLILKIELITLLHLLLYLIISYFMFFNLSMLLGCLSFWIVTLWPLRVSLNALMMLLGGLYFPLRMLGKNTYIWLQFNPFSLVTDVPAKLVISSDSNFTIYLIASIVWLISFGFLFKLAFQSGLKKFDGVGI
ncbi:ABC-2 family transporter protein [Lactobacillus mulieris]|uniref:ABC-2 family transporter protein n=1 Tax=Lactobacillus mulieris TaxID=2508708 RepID=UPI001432EF4C|nr:ABC-2 family transporter protein [Lactobacillus mulieris]MCF1783299.1 ABC-2 family transporter protein [Lactobacillus mulieris]MCW8104499.1 ABC-2 family transporter protein [Lactobacillus mulieris]MDK6802944.1 ABC-2 family transporter protein [Lactobacillus mulieris]MDK8382060.1 ABC-2 family transporter protein [Lactobacillus mulieris]MDT9620276.1 ABC-2 family transporter protein [Lactobacillus mulieris]